MGNLVPHGKNQQKRVQGHPSPACLHRLNCLMPPRYKDQRLITELVAFPELVHIDEDANGKKDLSAVIKPGSGAWWIKEAGINGGHYSNHRL